MAGSKLAKATLALLLTIFFCISSAETCLGQESAAAIQSAGTGLGSISALLPRKPLKDIPAKVEIYQFDNSPLGSRKPLLLVHGLLGEFHPLFRWKELAEYLSRDKAFQNKYKIYMARFDSSLPLKDITEQFKLALRDLPPSDKTTIIAISLAGSIVRNAMKDPDVDRSISQVITMGAFFRGSPLFCPDWMRQSILKRHISPFYLIHRPLGYKVYFSLHKNLLQDYAWDNVDGQMPTPSLNGKKVKFVSASISPVQTSSVASSQQASDRKFIVYAGYLRNRYFPRQQSGIRTFVTSPIAFLRTTLPAHARNEHAALRLLNYLVADALPGDNSKRIIYPLNDGISPISSSLLLSDEFVANSDLSNLDELKNIRKNSSARKTRLFEDADHLTFIEEPGRNGSAGIKDVLSLTEEPRPMFDWVLNDLLE